MGVTDCSVYIAQSHGKHVDRIDALSCALVTATASASMLQSTGTRSTAFSMLATHAAVAHLTCLTK
eukprot:196421-Prymnesium_polylepis.1